MNQHSLQEEFVNGNKNFRYLVGGRRCGKTTLGVKAICNFVSKGKSGIIIAPKKEIPSIKNKIRTELRFLEETTDREDKIKFLSIEDNLSGIRPDWIWLNKTMAYDEWRIWNVLVPRLRGYPTKGILLLTEEKSLLLKMIHKNEYDIVLMNWDEVDKLCHL